MKKEEIKHSSLHHAMIAVMEDVKNIDKSMTVGKGNNSYKGVADKDVKQAIGKSMRLNGLTCMCIDLKPNIKVDRWEEETQYGKKQKQSVFTTVLATYRITHADTGESCEIIGYGHGVDSMDKSAGKATTYALKNALLYTFLVPTGAIDDTDATHSSDIQTPVKKKPVKKEPKTLEPQRFAKALQAFKEGKTTEASIREYELTEEQSRILLETALNIA